VTITATPSKTNTPIASMTNTPVASKTNTPVIVPTNTNTPITTTGSLKVQIQNGGADSNQQSQFHYNIVNTSSSAVTNISVRLYITIDNTQPISKYVLEKYYDQSGVVAISGPTLASGSVYYWTMSYGTYSLAAGQAVQYQGAFHLNDWSNNFDPSNDAFHAGYATGALPSAYSDTTHIPAYVNGSLVWGVTP
jgi:hypothetical protein